MTWTRSAWLVIFSVAALVACTGPDAPPAAQSPPPVPVTVAPSVRAVCPNPHGGECLGDLAAASYRTTTFHPAIDYTVPAGWRNDEDLAGNFLLYRVQDDMSIGGGSYLGIYQNVAAAAINCLEQPQPGVARNAKALVDWFRSIPGLMVSTPKAITIGALTGYQIDIDVTRDKEACTFDGGAAHGTPLITGGGVSSLHHVAASDIHVQLLILDWHTGNVTLEITSAKALFAPGAYAALVQPIVSSLRFGA